MSYKIFQVRKGLAPQRYKNKIAFKILRAIFFNHKNAYGIINLHKDTNFVHIQIKKSPKKIELFNVV